jgi:hypothetical protein
LYGIGCNQLFESHCCTPDNSDLQILPPSEQSRPNALHGNAKVRVKSVPLHCGLRQNTTNFLKVYLMEKIEFAHAQSSDIGAKNSFGRWPFMSAAEAAEQIKRLQQSMLVKSPSSPKKAKVVEDEF